MGPRQVLYRVDAGVAHVVLNRPEKLNALGIGPGSNRAQLAEAMEQADADPAVGAILVSAAGRAFCAGGDMTGVPRAESPREEHQFIQALAESYARLRRVRKPTVAAVHGLCLGSGVSLIAQFDLVIAGDDARFGLVEGRIGYPAAAQIVPVVGGAWAKFLVFTGEIIDARRAEQIGLALAVVPADLLLERCLDLARRLARRPRQALLMSKASVDGALEALGGTGRSVGHTRDVVTSSMSFAARAPDGRLFAQILKDEGTAGLKQARDAQYGAPWLGAMNKGS
jgi:enoyl-CoA hydratase/carnithine racemase